MHTHKPGILLFLNPFNKESFQCFRSRLSAIYLKRISNLAQQTLQVSPQLQNKLKVENII